jgi:hypothetical protein
MQLVLLDRCQGTEFFTIIIIYRANTLNEMMEQKRNYILVGYAVTHQDFCNISEFSSLSWMQRHDADRVSSFNLFLFITKINGIIRI